MAVEHVFKFIFGLFLILVGVYLLAMFWWQAFLTLLKGVVPVFLGLVGLVFILLSFEK